MFQTRTIFYFSLNTWTMAGAGEINVPVRSIQYIRALNATRPGFDAEIVQEYTNFFAGNMTGDDDGRIGVWHIPEHCLAVFQPISFPTISPVFEVSVDISRNNHTFHIKEYRDLYNDRSRFEIRNSNGRSNTTLYFLDKMVKFHIANGACQQTDLTKDQLAKEIELTLLSGLTGFASTYTPRYLGQQVQREINCDRWWLNYTTDRYYLVNFYFSAEDWDIDRVGKHRVPVRFEVEGYEYNPRTYQPLPRPPTFWMYFDYSGYHTMQPPASTFVQPTVCLPPLAADAGVALGVLTLTFSAGSVFAGFIGFSIAFAIFGFAIRRPLVVIPETTPDALINE